MPDMMLSRITGHVSSCDGPKALTEISTSHHVHHVLSYRVMQCDAMLCSAVSCLVYGVVMMCHTFAHNAGALSPAQIAKVMNRNSKRCGVVVDNVAVAVGLNECMYVCMYANMYVST